MLGWLQAHSAPIDVSAQARPMNTGIYFDLRNPPQWAADPGRVFGFTLEMCEEADSAWMSLRLVYRAPSVR